MTDEKDLICISEASDQQRNKFFDQLEFVSYILDRAVPNSIPTKDIESIYEGAAKVVARINGLKFEKLTHKYSDAEA